MEVGKGRGKGGGRCRGRGRVKRIQVRMGGNSVFVKLRGSTCIELNSVDVFEER